VGADDNALRVVPLVASTKANFSYRKTATVARELVVWNSRLRAMLAIASFIATYPTSRIMSQKPTSGS